LAAAYVHEHLGKKLKRNRKGKPTSIEVFFVPYVQLFTSDHGDRRIM
jgi:hypothetical protein